MRQTIIYKLSINKRITSKLVVTNSTCSSCGPIRTQNTFKHKKTQEVKNKLNRFQAFLNVQCNAALEISRFHS